MQPYANHHGDSPITRFELRLDAVVVEFNHDRSYVYSHRRAGALHVARMKLLAVAGRGLGTYISRHVHDLYDR